MNVKLYPMNNFKERALRQLERKIQTYQGKGYMGGVTAEFHLVSTLISKIKKNNLLFLDIGAHHGEYSMEMLKHFPKSQIYAFEPSFESFKILEKNLPFVDKYNLALGAKNQPISIFSDQIGSTQTSLYQRLTSGANDKFAIESAGSMQKLDDWNKDEKKFDFAKIDAEGSELEILIGGEKTLGSTGIIQFEFGGPNIDSRTYFRDFWIWFTDHNFNIFRMAPQGLQRVDKYRDLDEVFRTTNYVAVSSDLKYSERK